MNLDISNGNHYGVRHLLSPKSGRVSDAISASLDLSEDRIHQLIEFGSVYVEGHRCTQNQQVNSETYIRVHQNPRRFPIEKFRYAKSLLFENEDLLIIDKPSGLPVHPTVDNLHENILSLINRERQGSSSNPAVYITHRLDVATCGLLILAKSKNAQTRINQLFAEGQVKKIYRALVHGSELAALPSGELIHYMEPSPRAPKNVSSQEFPGWALCKLKIIDQHLAQVTGPNSSTHRGLELTIELLTGRTHQIRAQMKAIGHPVLGDVAYGSTFSWPQSEGHEQIGLQCSFLGFPKDLSILGREFSTAIGSTPAPAELMSFRLASRPWSLI